MELNYATNSKTNAALSTGIIGTALGAINSGLLGGVFGNGNCSCGTAAYACSDNMAINRYEATQQARIAELETEVKLRDANFYTLSEMGKLRDYVDGRFSKVESEICEQKVYNAANTATVSCMASQIAQLQGLAKLVVPNSSICPGWGEATITPAATTTTGA